MSVHRPLIAIATALLVLGGAPSAIAAAPAAETAGAGFYRLPLGKFTVIALADGLFQMPARKLLIDDHPGAAEALLDKAGYTDTVPTSVNAFLIDTGSKRVLIDTGTGAPAGSGLGEVLAHLRAAGYAPEQIDEVLITHLHGDHAGGLAKDGHAVFPNAVLRLEQREADFWLDKANQDKADASVRGSFDTAAAALAPYRAAGHLKTFAPGATLEPGITALDTAGHTPGHASYRIESGGKTMLVWGDLLHVAAVQFPDPKVTIHFDSTPAQAEAIREKVLAEAANNGEWIAAAHIAFPGIGHITATGSGYVWEPAPQAP